MEEEKKDMELQSSARESFPLLSKKEPADLYTEATDKPNAWPSVRNHKRAIHAMLEAEISREHRDTPEELAEVVNSSEGMADVIFPSKGCGLFCGIWICMCHCLSSFVIQFPLHVLLLVLPISIGFMGAKYMTECPMSAELPYSMIVVGGVGTIVLLVRLTLLLHTKFSTEERLKKWLKTGIKLLECVFLLSLIIELYFSYKNSPSYDSFSSDYCNQDFYSFVNLMNNVLISLAIGWIFLYCITRQQCLRRPSPP